MEEPLVSVTITTYNSSSTIHEVLEAILKQEYSLKKIEVIVVDGHSYDETLKIVEDFKSKYGHLFHRFEIIKHDKNYGVSRARNDGIKESNGEYVLILDSDVILPSSAIKRMVEFLNSNHDSGGCVLLHKSDYEDFVSRYYFDVNFGVIRKIFHSASACMIRRKCFERGGFFDESLGPPFSVDEDLELGARMWKHGCKIFLLGDTVANHYERKRDINLLKLHGSKSTSLKSSLITYMNW